MLDAAPAAGRIAQPARTEPAMPGVREGRFAWPVRGRVLSGFGPKPDGLRNDGVNIAVPEGSPVRAAERGTVVYVGNELRGYGTLILLKHADGWLTAYAHLGSTTVDKGDRVGPGQVVGTVGKSGAVVDPQLHFEVRRGSQAVNPLEYLRPVS